MDQLTGAADTGELMAQEALLETRARNSDIERRYGLVLVDLVELRKLNSEFDWSTGDGVLIEMAHRLQRLCPQACVARVEADKFAVLVDGLDQDGISTEGHRLRHELMSSQWEVGGNSVAVLVRVNSVSGPLPHFTNLLWAAQRMSREHARWKLKQQIQEFENLARLMLFKLNWAAFNLNSRIQYRNAMRSPGL
jgi:diguanylate cyclase (GGDEF)-like protein